MDRPVHIVVLERDEAVVAFIASQLPKEYDCRFVATAEAAEALIDSRTPDLFLCADDLDNESGLMFLARTRDKWTTLRRILMVPDPDPEFFFHVSREMPVLSYLGKPVKKQELLHILRHGLQQPPALDDPEEEPTQEEPSLLSRSFIRMGTWTIVIIIGAIIVVAVLLIIYQIKCKFGTELLPE